MTKPRTLLDIAQTFAQTLTKSAKGQKTSIGFLRHQLPTSALAGIQEYIQILVIGGSICQTATAKKNGDAFTFSEVVTKAQPIFTTKDSFLGFLKDKIKKDTSILAVNFAFPIIPNPRGNAMDGTLLSGTKEHVFSGLVGLPVGEIIEIYLQNTLSSNLSVTLANDAICLLLAGSTKAPWDSLACGIVGTGVNFAIADGLGQAVNLESGNFNEFPKSQTLAAIDALSQTPGQALFEKEVAGAYLYQHFNEIVRQQHLPYPLLKSTQELKKLALDGNSHAKELLEHSAGLVASQIAGILLYKQQSMLFLMEGSFFWEDDIYAELVKESLIEMKLPFTATFFRITDSPLLGAAVLPYLPL